MSSDFIYSLGLFTAGLQPLQASAVHSINTVVFYFSYRHTNLHSKRQIDEKSLHIWSSGFFYRVSSCLELPVRRTAWTIVNCEQFQTVT